LFKEHDEFARPQSAGDVLTELPKSAKTGRTMDEIAEGRRPKRPKKSPPTKTSRRKRAARSTASRGVKSGNPSIHSLAKLAGARRRPLPKRIEAQLATLVKEPPTGENWLHEQKFDGYRMLCRIEDGRVRFTSRNQQDWTGRLESLVPTIQKLPLRQAILDGEVAVLDSHGVSSFQALQNAFGERRTGQLLYFVFDLVHLDGYDLTAVTLEERKAVLKRLIDALQRGAHIRFSEHMEGTGPKLRKKMCDLGLEGMISKRRDAPYVAGRTLTWLKSKCRLEQEFVIAGFTPPEGARVGFGSLLLGYYRPDGKLAYAGRVGTGFNAKLLSDLLARLKKIEQKKPPFAEISHRSWLRAVHWVQPKLVAQVEFSNWTDEGLVRQAAFRGLREDKPPREVKRESPIRPPKFK
jgi:bifunctional non-homologous end joining protein LigD